MLTASFSRLFIDRCHAQLDDRFDLAEFTPQQEQDRLDFYEFFEQKRHEPQPEPQPSTTSDQPAPDAAEHEMRLIQSAPLGLPSIDMLASLFVIACDTCRNLFPDFL